MPPTACSPLRNAHPEAGTAFAERGGRALVASYGDPPGEYAATLDGCGLVDLGERAVLVASGPKRTDLLQGMLSNDVAGRRAGQGCQAAILDAKGHVRFLLRTLVENETIRLETDRDRLELLRRTLEHHRVAAPVEFERPPTGVLGLLGLGAGDLLRSLEMHPPTEPGDHARTVLRDRPVLMARAGDLPGGGFVLHVLPEDAAEVWATLRAAGARPVGRDVLDTRRIEEMRPWYGIDVSEENLLHETGLLGECHSPTKGCYVGQEVVARLEARGANVSRALRRLRLAAPSAPGARVRAAGAEVGWLTSAGTSPRYGPIAMGFVHRSHFAPGRELDVDGTRATVVAVFDEG